MFTHLSCIIKKKFKSMIKRKKRTIEKVHQMGMENYIKSKIERYADSPALVAHFKSELDHLKAKMQ